MTYYVLYQESGVLKRAVFNENGMRKLEVNPSITNIQVFSTQQLMEKTYSEEKGQSGAFRKTLLG